MGNGALGNTLNPPAYWALPGKDSADCQAYRAAVKRWCKETNEHRKKCAEAKAKGDPAPPFPERGRKFNDYHYEELGKIDPSLAARTRREVPFGVTSGFGGGATHQGMPGFIAANAGTPAARTGMDMRRMHLDGMCQAGSTTSGFWDGQRHQMNQAAGGLGSGNRPFYPDGVRDGNAMEIKGPGDREGPSQYKKYAEASPSGQCTVINPDTCGGEGLTPGGRCAAA